MEAHLEDCLACPERVARHRRCRQLLRRQPREAAPPEVRARVVRAVHRRAVWHAVRPWLAVPAAATLIGLAGWGLKGLLLPTPVVASLATELVDMHVAYSRIDVPVEFASASGPEVREWFHERLWLRVVVPDYAPAGIHLLGGRLAETAGHPTAYLVYEKGHTLMSVFVVSGAAARFAGSRTRAFRGSAYEAIDVGGQHGVFWAEDGWTFAVVSSLEYGDLLQCADRLRTEWQTDRDA